MRFFDYIRVAFQNLVRQKARTFLTIFAVVIGSVSVVIMLSLVLGARGVFVRQLESIGGLTLISISGDASESGGDNLFNTNGNNSSDTKKIDDKAIADLKKVDHLSAVTPLASIWASSMKLKDTEKKNNRMGVIAIDPDAHVFDLPVAAGRAITGSDMDKILIGAQSMRIFGFTKPEEALGKKVVFEMQGSTSDWEPDPPLPKPNPEGDSNNQPNKEAHLIEAEIVGVMTAGPDDGRDFITIGWAKRLMTQKRWEFDNEANKALETEQHELESEMRNKPVSGKNYQKLMEELNFKRQNIPLKLVKYSNFEQNGYGGAMAKADSTEHVKSTGEALKKLGYGVTTAQDMLDGISKIFLALGLVLGAIGGIALLVAAIGIINTMAMAIYERTREIGVMRACGATKSTVRRLFTFEAALLGFWGGVIGLLISYGLARIGNLVADHFATSLNVPINDLISFPLWLIGGTIAFTTLIGWLAGVIPAFRAARLDPVEALRYE